MKKLICVILVMLLLAACGAQPAADTQATTTQPASGVVSAQVDGQELVFEPWEQEGLPQSGAYYLTRDVVLEGCVEVTGQLMLHLNGHTVSGAEGIRYGAMFHVAADGELGLFEAAEGLGTVVSPRSFTAMPYVLNMFSVEGTLGIYGGTMDSSAVSLENIANGTVFNVKEGGVVNMYSGMVLGGSTICYSLDPEKNNVPDTLGEPTEGTEPVETQPDETAPTETQPLDGVVEEEVIQKELFGKGGTAYLAPGAQFNLYGGEIAGGIGGLGGNFYVELGATLYVGDATISDGEAMFHGGNIYNDGTVKMEGGQLLRGIAYNNGGNIFMTGTLEVNGGAICEGRCDASGLSGKRGANILVNGLDAVVNIANCEILDGDGHGSENFGGNISVIGQCAKEFSLTDCTITGGQAHRGGNLYFGTLAKDVSPDNLDFYMKNCTISGGTCSYRGANMCMDSDLEDVYVNLVMDDCHFLMDEVTRESISLGAGSWIDSWVTLTMNGGSIEGGSINLYGDSTLTANGTEMTMDTHGGQGTLVKNP